MLREKRAQSCPAAQVIGPQSTAAAVPPLEAQTVAQACGVVAPAPAHWQVDPAQCA